jgi:hypothetical protein
VELKVDSDTPLHAAIEIIQYGMVWILSRQHRLSLGYGELPILDAKVVQLTVLAPARYYRCLDLSALAQGLNTATSILGIREARVALSFEFHAFPNLFEWPATRSESDLRTALDGRRCWEIRQSTHSAPVDNIFLPGLPTDLIRATYAAAPGNEIESGKFANPASSAALVANAFVFFLKCPPELPAFPAGADWGWPPVSLTLEAIVRFPWSGGSHPCLDVLIGTRTTLLGIESKRYEPFRTKQRAELSDAYWQPVWGAAMRGYERVRDGLRDARVCTQIVH